MNNSNKYKPLISGLLLVALVCFSLSPVVVAAPGAKCIFSDSNNLSLCCAKEMGMAYCKQEGKNTDFKDLNAFSCTTSNKYMACCMNRANGCNALITACKAQCAKKNDRRSCPMKCYNECSSKDDYSVRCAFQYTNEIKF